MIKSIVLGMREGELGPLDSPELCRRGLLEEKVRKIHERAQQNGSLCFETARNALLSIHNLKEKGETEIEVYGAWEDLCVTVAIGYAIKKGLDVRVPKDFIYKAWEVRKLNLKDTVKQISEYTPKNFDESLYCGFPYLFSEDNSFFYFKSL